MDYLDRASAPLTSHEWEELDKTVVSEARKRLVGRRFIPILGPVGAGVEVIPRSVFEGSEPATVSILGGEDTEPVEARRASPISLPMIYRDFKLSWRDIENARRLGIPLDLSVAAAAATSAAFMEDRYIFNGSGECGHQGLFNVDGRLTVQRDNWDSPGTALADVVKAQAALQAAGHPGPYAIALSPVLYAKLIRLYGNTATLELEQVEKMAEAGVFVSPVLAADQAVMTAVGAQNMELVVGQDLTTAYLGPEKMNHLFRVFETLALLIKRRDAICVIG